MCTYLTGYYNRNDRVRKLLEDKNDEFAEKEEVVDILNSASDFINRLDFYGESIWWSKANFFGLMCEVAREPRIIAVGVGQLGNASCRSLQRCLRITLWLPARQSDERARENSGPKQSVLQSWAKLELQWHLHSLKTLSDEGAELGLMRQAEGNSLPARGSKAG